MKHVNAIKNIVAEGRFEEAHRAIEDLLELGPNNLEALKLKASLYEHVGRFEDEWTTWRRILETDSDDEEAIDFFQKSQIEDREHYYFTDPLPGGGRKYLTYPRALVTVSFVGLIGCVCFLLLTRTTGSSLTQNPELLLATFAALVLSPWVAIVYLYIKTIRCINVTKFGFEVSTRFKSFNYAWSTISHIYLVHSENPDSPDLRLIVVPQDQNSPPLSIDFAEDSTPVRARRHLLQEIREHFQDIRYEPKSSLSLDKKPAIRF